MGDFYTQYLNIPQISRPQNADFSAYMQVQYLGWAVDNLSGTEARKGDRNTRVGTLIMATLL
jgi:hypothetical protein